MKNVSLLFAIAFVLYAVSAFCQVSIEYGNDKTQLAFINQNNHPGIQEPLPLGPLAFRIHKERFFIADSVGGKILIASKKNTDAIKQVTITATPSEMLFDDLVLETDKDKVVSIWLIEALGNCLINVNGKGEIVRKIESDKFIQPFRIEISSSGLIVVADKGARSIFVFKPEGEEVIQLPWEWSGMGLSPDADILYRIFFAPESSTSFLVNCDFNGDITSEIELDLGEHFNTELLWVDEEKQEFLITYGTSQTYQTSLNIARIGFDGAVRGLKDIKLPFAMNRYIVKQGKNAYLAVADFEAAPEGTFKIVSFELP
jgi:hypothetical protein